MSLLNAMRYAISSITNINRSTQILSENISSANDDNYVRRYTRSVDLPHGGVGISEVRRATDEILQRNMWNVRAEAAAASALSDYYTRLQELSGVTNDITLLSDAIGQLTNGFKEMEAAPSVDASRQSVLFAARAVRDEFERLSSEAFELRARINSDIVDTVDEVNSALREIANYNRRIAYESRLSTVTSKVENFIDERIDTLAENFDIRVFRGPDKSYRIYTRNGLALLDSIPAQFSWSGDDEVLRNTLTGFDVTNDLPQGRLKTQIDFIARKTRVDGSSVTDVVENDDLRLGVLSKFETQLDKLASLLVGDSSTTKQGHDNGLLIDAGPPRVFADGIPQSALDTLSENFGNIVYPRQIYVREGAGFARANGAFFVDRSDLSKLYDSLTKIVADGNTGAANLDVQSLTTEQRQFFRSVAGTATPATATRVFDISLDAVVPAPPSPGGEVWVEAADVRAAVSRFKDLLEGEAIPADIIHVANLKSFVLQDGTTVNPPASTPGAAPYANQNHLTLDQVRRMRESVDNFISDPTANPLGTVGGAAGSYAGWDPAMQHLFRMYVNEINPALAQAGVTTTEAHLGLNMNQLQVISDKLKEVDSDVLPPSGSATGSLEHYWSDKLFVPPRRGDQDLEDVDRFNLEVNPNLPDVLEKMRFDSDKIGKIVRSLIANTRDVKVAGLVVNDRDYAGMTRSFGIDTARRAGESDKMKERTGNIKDTLVINYRNSVGVNLDAEMSKVVVLQNSYAATARVITTVTRMFEILEKVFV
jgi:flagellar hook-associated protein 1 FlgK